MSNATTAMVRLLQRPRTRFLIATFVIAAVSLALLYHSLGVKHQPTPTSHFVLDSRSKVAAQPEDPTEEGLRRFEAHDAHGSCPRMQPLTDVDISTCEVYSTLNFKPPYRGYWNYTFEKRYLQTRENWDQLPLKVIVVPHSHNDPGWLKTFDGYFMAYTAHILNNMVDKLARYRDMTFVWAEISFFSRWWNSLKNRPNLREQVRNFIHRGQLEMLTGGWVMTDEAASHYFAMVDQLVEGHQWMTTNLGIIPRTGWSIDSFGHSATVAYLLRASGMHNMVIQRTHYAWKAYLAEKQHLDFWWRQEFDNAHRRNNSMDILCQMMPFDLYSIKHSCGPDPDICLQFDFRRIPGEYSESRAIPVTPDKLEERAELLLGQYGRIGSLFPHNVALVPLGDDFRYNHDIEWDQQHDNYRKLMDYINSRTEWNAEVRFGTVRDYFNEVHKRMQVLNNEKFPVLVGDFHAYGDIYGEGRPSYWTGYFTTRPYWKHMCRDLEYWLRNAEILYSLARAYVRQEGMTHLTKRLDQDYAYLTLARDSLGLFQHHDAITGTSKEAVMADYGMRLFRGIREAMGVIAHASLYLMAKEPVKRSLDLRPAHPLTSFLFPDVEQTQFDKLPEKVPLTVPSLQGRKIVVFNSKAHWCLEPVRVKVKSAFVKLFGPDGVEVEIQINPAWNGSVEMLSDVYEVLFIAELAPLSLVTYTLVASESSPRPRSQVSVTLNDAFARQPHSSIFSFLSPIDTDIELTTPHLSASFSKHTGLLQTMELTAHDLINRVVMVLQAYKSEEFRSGAYLFHPLSSDPVQNISGRFPIIRVVSGQLSSEVTTIYSGAMSITYRVYHTMNSLGYGVEMETTFDITQLSEINLELFLRLQSDIGSGNVFYADANGFQMMKRQTNTQLPLEANFYPATSAIFIEDSRSRLTLLLSHAHGVASVHSGWMEVMLDRRLRSDDNRGLGEGVLDNKRTLARFWLLLEKRDASSDDKDEVPNLSLTAHVLSAVMSHPAVVIATHGIEQRSLKPKMEFLENSFPGTVHLVNLRTVPKSDDFEVPSNTSLMILHNKGQSYRVLHPVMASCSIPVNVAFRHIRTLSVQRTSLTGLHLVPTSDNSSSNLVVVNPMEIYSYNIKFAP